MELCTDRLPQGFDLGLVQLQRAPIGFVPLVAEDLGVWLRGMLTDTAPQGTEQGDQRRRVISDGTWPTAVIYFPGDESDPLITSWTR